MRGVERITSGGDAIGARRAMIGMRGCGSFALRGVAGAPVGSSDAWDGRLAADGQHRGVRGRQRGDSQFSAAQAVGKTTALYAQLRQVNHPRQLLRNHALH